MALKPRKSFEDIDETDPSNLMLKRIVQDHIARANRETVVIQEQQAKEPEVDIDSLMFHKKQAS